MVTLWDVHTLFCNLFHTNANMEIVTMSVKQLNSVHFKYRMFWVCRFIKHKILQS